MINRHESSQGNYPFVAPGPTESTLTAGILDVYVVCFGQPDGTDVGSSGGSSSDAGDNRRLWLRDIQTTGSTTTFTFRAQKNSRYWDILFDVDHTAGLHLATAKDGSKDAVLVVDADQIFTGTRSGLVVQAEGSRVEFHDEQVDSVQFLNIWRNASVEDPSILLPVALFDASSEIPLKRGYNTELFFDENESVLRVDASAGSGEGAAPDYGDTAGSVGVSVGSSQPDDFIAVINGIVASGGSIPVEVSAGLGLEGGKGFLTIVVKQ